MTRPLYNQEKKNVTVPADHRVILTESEKKYMYLDFAKELKKNVEHESSGYLIDVGALSTVTKCLVKITRTPGNKGTNGDNSKYNIVEIGQNTEIRGDLRRLVSLKLQ